MSRPRDPDGFDDGTGWHEPEHLGDGPAGPGEPAPSWEPPGWSLPPAPPDAPDVQAVVPDEDPFGLRAEAAGRGWTVSDGSGPGDAVLRNLLATGPVRLGSEHRPAGVVRGRWGNLDLVAFDVVHPLGRRTVYQYAVTAAPMLGAVPALRLSPARLWKHRTGGLLAVPSGDPEFDTRWTLLAAEDGPQVRRLVEDPTVRGLLLGSDDGDEFWTAAGFVAVIRPDAHRPVLLDHHGRLLTAVVGALAAAAL
jgi:hypothetical protein